MAVRLSPDVPVVFYNRGVAYGRKGKLERAIDDYNQAIQLNPNYSWAYYRRAEAYANKREFARAIGDYTKRSGWILGMRKRSTTAALRMRAQAIWTELSGTTVKLFG